MSFMGTSARQPPHAQGRHQHVQRRLRIVEAKTNLALRERTIAGQSQQTLAQRRNPWCSSNSALMFCGRFPMAAYIWLSEQAKSIVPWRATRWQAKVYFRFLSKFSHMEANVILPLGLSNEFGAKEMMTRTK